MAFVTFAGESFGGGAAAAVAARRLQQVEKIEAQCLFDRRIAVDSQVGFSPEGIAGIGLACPVSIEVLRQCTFQRCGDGLEQGGFGVAAFRQTPCVGDVFFQDDALARRQLCGVVLLHALPVFDDGAGKRKARRRQAMTLAAR